MKGVTVEVWMAAMVGPSVRSHWEMERGIASSRRGVSLKMIRRVKGILKVVGGLLTLSWGVYSM